MAWDVPCAARTASFTVSPHFAAGVISALPPNARPRRPRMALRGGVHQFLVTLSQPNRFGRVASNGRLAAVCTDQGRCAPPSTKRHAPRRSSHTATPATSPTYHQRSYPGSAVGATRITPIYRSATPSAQDRGRSGGEKRTVWRGVHRLGGWGRRGPGERQKASHTGTVKGMPAGVRASLRR